MRFFAYLHLPSLASYAANCCTAPLSVLLWKSKGLGGGCEISSKMSTAKSTNGQNIESLRAALAAAKAAVESLENALVAAEESAATVAVLAMVEVVEEPIPAEPVADEMRGVERLFAGSETSRRIPVVMDGVEVGHLTFYFNLKAGDNWSAWANVPDGRLVHRSCASRAECEEWLRLFAPREGVLSVAALVNAA